MDIKFKKHTHILLMRKTMIFNLKFLLTSSATHELNRSKTYDRILVKEI